MKKALFIITLLFSLFPAILRAQIDPVLPGTLSSVRNIEKKENNKISQSRREVIPLSGGVLLQVKAIEDINKKVFSYLSTINNATHFLNYTFQALETSKAINKNTKKLIKATKRFEGVVGVFIDSKIPSKLNQEVQDLIYYINRVCLPTQDSEKGQLLLSSTQRIDVVTQINWRLTQINTSIILMTYQLEQLTLASILLNKTGIDLTNKERVNRKKIANRIAKNFKPTY